MSNLYVGGNPLGSVVLTYDTEATPTEGSKKALTSGGAFNALAEKQDVLAGAEGQLVGFDADGKPAAQDSWQSNRNLLDNWYFGNPVNQSGQASYSGAVYGIDRWKGVYGAEVVTVADGYVKLTLSGNQAVRQVLEFPKILSGQTVTMSVIWSLTGNYANTYFASNTGVIGKIGKPTAFGKTLDTVTFSVPSGSTNLSVDISGDGEINVYAVKLEIGYRQTLAHKEANGSWVLNEVPNYAEELAKCQRYMDICSAIRVPANASLWIPYHQQMRTVPAVTFVYNEDNLFEFVDGTVKKDGFLVRNKDTAWARWFGYRADANV